MVDYKEVRLISVIVPSYNEAASLPKTIGDLVEVLSSGFSKRVKFEILIVNDGSTDDTKSVVNTLQNEHKKSPLVLRYIHLTRNFGKEAAVFAGYAYSKGDAVGCLDADGQHPPLEMANMIHKLLKSDAQVVMGVRSDQTHKKIGFMSSMFYKVSKKLGNKSATVNGTDFRVMRRQAVDEFLKAKEHGRVNRDIMDWFGFESIIHEFKPMQRTAGKATYSFKKLVMLAIDGLVASGTKPLFFMFPVGMVIFLFGFASLLLTSLSEFIFGDPLGLAMTAQGYALLLIVSLFGVVLSVLGILALYVGRIALEVQDRPHYVVDEQRNS